MRGLRWLARSLGGVLSVLLGLVPAFLAGAGVFLVVAGLMNYMAPVAAQPNATPTFGISPAPSVSLLSPPPQASGSPSASPTAGSGGALATRVQVPALSIDLPVVASVPNEKFPLCNAAEYFIDSNVAPPKPLLATPGAAAATYLYAHARTGMFLPILSHSLVNNGNDMKDMYVIVYTDDDQQHIYQITEVHRHVTDIGAAFGAETDQLWLQTSEGPYVANAAPGQVKDLVVVATPFAVLPADHAEAHPTNKGHVCPDAPR